MRRSERRRVPRTGKIPAGGHALPHDSWPPARVTFGRGHEESREMSEVSIPSQAPCAVAAHCMRIPEQTRTMKASISSFMPTVRAAMSPAATRT